MEIWELKFISKSVFECEAAEGEMEGAEPTGLTLDVVVSNSSKMCPKKNLVVFIRFWSLGPYQFSIF